MITSNNPHLAGGEKYVYTRVYIYIYIYIDVHIYIYKVYI